MQEAKGRDDKILALIQERKSTAKNEKENIREISKEITKCIRDNKWSKRQETFQKILEKVKGTRNKTRQGIANVFAKFYEDLHEGEEGYTEEDVESCTEDDKTVTNNEIQDSIDRLRKRESERQLWNTSLAVKKTAVTTRKKNQDNLQLNCAAGDFTPKCWRKIRIHVINKKGDREDAGNLRPICSLPVLYKLFATVLYARLAHSLRKIQPPDQAGFRPNHRCDDHLIVYRILEQRCREWGVPLYISTIDFTKAFDRREATATALQPSGRYGFDGQRERRISDQKGDQTGRPTVLPTVHHGAAKFSGKRSETVAKKQKGIRLSDKIEDCMTNLRLADDVLLFSA